MATRLQRLRWLPVVALLLVGGVTIPDQASAQDATTEENDARARVLFQAGTVQYESGEYEQALAQFELAYRLSQRPVLLYNIALTRERLGDMEGTLQAFRDLQATNVEVPGIDATTLRNRISALERRIERRRSGEEDDEGEDGASSTGGPSDGNPQVDPDVLQRPPEEGGSDDGLIIGLSAGIGGAVALGVVIALVVVFAGQSEQPYEGTLFSARIP